MVGDRYGLVVHRGELKPSQTTATPCSLSEV
jgi:hypothetical protein